ncbi:hypothetical protein, partial [Jannaschia seosinensis]|uniref:hypothetical protein n=1 Tax=Jannaschia seosinensis TaxID=313367 RepID=UPI000A7AF057
MQQHSTSPPPTGVPVPQILRDWLQELRMCFTAPSWEHVLVLVMGAMLAPGKRTVSACLRMTGRAEDSVPAVGVGGRGRSPWRSVARGRV